MVAVSAWLFGVVSFGASSLVSIPGKNGGINIKCIVIKLQVTKKPLIQWRENVVINGRCMLIEKTLKGFAASHLLKSPTLPHNLILAGYFTMLKFIGTTPNTRHNLLYKLIG